MKLNTGLILLILLISVKINILSQNKEEINNKIKSIISQEKYNYQTIKGNVLPRQEPKYKNIIDKIISFFIKVFNILKKVFLLIWSISPVFSIIIFIGLFSLFVLFILWIFKQIDLSIKSNTKLKTNIETEEGHFNYIREFNLAKQMIAEKKLKEAVSILINSMWLFYYSKKVLKYEKSRTNREYLKSLINLSNYELIKKIIFNAERAVYYKENIDENECEEILWNVSEIFSQ